MKKQDNSKKLLFEMMNKVAGMPLNENIIYRDNKGKLKKHIPINGKLINTISPESVGGMEFGIYEMPNGGYSHEFSGKIFSDYPEATNDLQIYINELIRDYNDDVSSYNTNGLGDI